MPFQVLRHIRKSAGQLACSSMLYNWSLRSGGTPERLIVKPVDPWPGDSDAGRWLCNGSFMIDDDQLELRGECWNPVGVDNAWLEHMHGFTWLRDLRALGGIAARQQAKAMTKSWIYNHSRWQKIPWRPDITGERISMWIALYESFGASASDDFQELFFASLIHQARHLSKSLPADLHGIALLKGIKGLLYAGLGFEGYEIWIEQALDLLEKEVNIQLLSDGAHISRSPAQLLEAFQILLDIRIALASGGYPLPSWLTGAIKRMGPALQFFRYGDRNFGLFNGAQKGDKDYINCIIRQAGLKGKKALQSLPHAGYERMQQERTLIMFDCGKPPEYPYDSKAHAAPLAFEMSYGKDRIFTSCGTHPVCEDWQDALRATSAHNTLTIDNRNACEIGPNGHFIRRVKKTTSMRQDSGQTCLLEASHDGYAALNGITHRRRLYLSNKGYDLRGEDSLNCSICPDKELDIAVRFHIHPRVTISLIRDGHEALLRLSGGTGWRFCYSGGMLALEDTVYLGRGTRPGKSKQLVIYGKMTNKTALIKWAVQREGI